ncbi:MAG: VWA domain-containing protein [Flavobacteriales bacterium]|nr:VWA domain-containing protein [Flavobacteriales bacterium]
MRYTYALLFSLLATLGSAQVTMDQTFHDFGEITKGHMRLAEFNLMNNSDKKVLILRADQDPELDIRFSSKTVEPGAYATVRIQFNPRSRGRVNKKIDLWISTSQEPFVLEMEGIVKELETSFQPCPSFTHPDKIQPIQFNMTAFVTDMTTGLPLGNATIQMLRNGIALDVPLITNEQGKVSKEIPLGLYYIVTSREGYATREASFYLNRSRNKVKVKLMPSKIEKEIVQPVEPVAPVVIQPEKEREQDPIANIGADPGDFSVDRYAANNIVFLIDVSASMRKEGRLDLLKASMLELVEILREIDQVSILTYTSTSKMVLEPINATESNKALMIKVIQGLEAKGSTVGGQAVRSAFEVVKAHYVKEGSNQVVMATDGQFRDNFKDMLKMVKKNSRGGRNISVIGIKNSSRSADQMREIATAGLGYYINIESYDDAQENLVQGIKASSLKE